MNVLIVEGDGHGRRNIDAIQPAARSLWGHRSWRIAG
jgi:hypothetical protein